MQELEDTFALIVVFCNKYLHEITMIEKSKSTYLSQENYRQENTWFKMRKGKEMDIKKPLTFFYILLYKPAVLLCNNIFYVLYKQYFSM